MAENRQKKDRKRLGISVILTVCILTAAIPFVKKEAEHQKENGDGLSFATHFLTNQMEQNFFILPVYLEARDIQSGPGQELEYILLRQSLLCRYAILMQEENREYEDEYMARIIRQAEGTDEDIKNIDEENLDYTENALHIENSMLQEMQRENNLHSNDTEKMQKENQGVEGQKEKQIFQAVKYPVYSYDWSEEWDYEKLVSNFYAVDKSTLLSEDYLNLNYLLKEDLSVDKTADGPQILIYHTHSREAFADSVAGDAATTIVGAGEKLASLLQSEYGFRVLHHQAEYDMERSEAYSVALPEIEKLLRDNPSIEVVIDLHRDEMTGDRRLVMDLQGRPTARFMFFNGLSYSKKNGNISYLENPYVQENLALSFQAQVAANEYYPGIARKVYLKAYRYNMHLKPRSMLIELGAQNNTVEEIMNACDPLAHILAIVLDEML